MLLQAVFLLATASVLVSGRQLTTEQIFRVADTDGDGRLRMEEYLGFMLKINPTPVDSDRIE